MRPAPAGGAALLLSLVGLAVVGGCEVGTYRCTDDGQCVVPGRSGATCGRLGEDRYCAYDDSACPSRKRWDDTAATAVRGRCVDPVDMNATVTDMRGTDGGEGGMDDLRTDDAADLSPPADLAMADLADGGQDLSDAAPDLTVVPDLARSNDLFVCVFDDVRSTFTSGCTFK